ncbi:MAG: hypothetical protein JWM16_6298, partial [Verrucomicrobiales bacterium]|nr:hypothetical protein [Verrucomicrobiales bacterium]
MKSLHTLMLASLLSIGNIRAGYLEPKIRFVTSPTHDQLAWYKNMYEVG